MTSLPPSETTEPMVLLQDLGVSFHGARQPVQAVSGVSLQVQRGEVVALIGESGSGKSVTMRTLLRLHPERRTRIAGTVRVAGQDVLAMGTRALADFRGKVASMIFQEPLLALDPVYPVGAQIVESIRRHEAVTKAEAQKRALALFERVRIPSPERRLAAYPHEMSGGMRQRAMIAIALASEPQLLIADEPTTALDVTVQAQVLDLLKGLQERLGTAMILITHDMGVVADVADRVSVMYAGRKVEDGALDDVLSAHAHPYTRALVACMPRQQPDPGDGRRVPLPEIPGVVPSTAALPPGCAFAPRCAQAMPTCTQSVPPMVRLQPNHSSACWSQLEGAYA